MLQCPWWLCTWQRHMSHTTWQTDQTDTDPLGMLSGHTLSPKLRLSSSNTCQRRSQYTPRSRSRPCTCRRHIVCNMQMVPCILFYTNSCFCQYWQKGKQSYQDRASTARVMPLCKCRLHKQNTTPRLVPCSLRCRCNLWTHHWQLEQQNWQDTTSTMKQMWRQQ